MKLTWLFFTLSYFDESFLGLLFAFAQHVSTWRLTLNYVIWTSNYVPFTTLFIIFIYARIFHSHLLSFLLTIFSFNIIKQFLSWGIDLHELYPVTHTRQNHSTRRILQQNMSSRSFMLTYSTHHISIIWLQFFNNW